MTARILVSNDDGIHAPGLHALVEAVTGLGEIMVVAPEREQSAASHALSLHRPLRIREVKGNWHSVDDGTPADCVYVAVNHLCKGKRPDLVVSGINHGPNLADDVIYSGTVAAAMEGAILGVPSIAFSLVSRKTFDFTHAAKFARELVRAALSAQLPKRMLLNVNVPSGELKGYAITSLGRHSYGADVIEKEDPRGRKYYWIGGTGYSHEPLEGSDCVAVHDQRRVSVTPLMLDFTDASFLKPLESWKIEGFSRG